MRKLAFTFIAALFLMGTPRAYAQECCPAWEAFGGYSYLNSSSTSDRITSDQFNSRYGMNGFGFNVARNISTKLGIVADFSRNARESTIGGITVGDTPIGEASVDLTAYTFLFGPRLSARSEGSNFFVQALAGAAHRQADIRSTLNTGASVTTDSSSTDFALGFGGGADIYASTHIAIRLFQFDYIPVRGRNDLSEKSWTHNYRLQVGVAVRWGLAK
jgi:opacity protein-like surface antigen